MFKIIERKYEFCYISLKFLFNLMITYNNFYLLNVHKVYESLQSIKIDLISIYGKLRNQSLMKVLMPSQLFYTFF